MRRAVIAGLITSVSLVSACGQKVAPVSIDELIDPEPVARTYGESVLSRFENSGQRPVRDFDRVEVVSGGPSGMRSVVVTLDRSQQRLRLDAPQDLDYDFDSSGSREAPIQASFEGMVSPRFVPASALGLKAKQFDDGLYAAVELAATSGAGRFPGRAGWLARLMAAAAESGDDGSAEAAGLLLAAIRLGGGAATARQAVEDAAEEITGRFVEDALRSKPLGFYTWNLDLARVFQRDRLLQSELKPAAARVLATVLAGDEELRKEYRAALRLPARLTNPFAAADLQGAIQAIGDGRSAELEDLALLPASRAHETDLVKKLYGNREVPDGFDLADALIAAVRAGRVDLTPTTESGFYDHQTWALEPLIRPETMPEADHLELTKAYRKELVGLFKGLLALTRETHVKQLEVPAAGAAAPGPRIVVEISPGLTVEPLPSHYLRRAQAYRFVRGVLVDAFGQEALFQMRRLTAGGPINLPLWDELLVMEGLFRGAYLTACGQIGLTPESDSDSPYADRPAVARALFEGWAERIAEDPDLGQDVRMMVPLFYDIARAETKVWAVLGVSRRPLQVRFAQEPKVVGLTTREGVPIDAGAVDVSFHGEGRDLAYLVTVETYVSELLDRQEFRRHCDKHRTFTAIVDALK